MPVNVSYANSLHGVAALQKVGIDDSTVVWLTAESVEVKLSATGFSFVKHGQVLATTPVGISALTELNKGTMPTHMKQALKNGLLKAIEAVGEKLSTVVGLDVSKGPDTAVETFTHTLSPVAIASKPTAMKPNDWAPVPKSMLMSMTPVKLRDATRLYQPVKGTSKNSRYFVVGGNADIRIAAKYAGGTLSVRVEGPNFIKYASNLTDVGFSKVEDSYASIHLSAKDDVVAAKALGALLLGLGVNLTSPMPNLNVFKSYG